MLTLLLYLIGAFVIGLSIWHRKNKFILYGLWLLTIALFFNALSQGGDEPLGRQFLEKTGQLSEKEKATTQYYHRFAENLIGNPEIKTPAPPPAKPKPTWFWWHLSLFFFFAAALTTTLKIVDKSAAVGKSAGQYLKETFPKIGQDVKEALKEIYRDWRTRREIKLLQKSQPLAAKPQNKPDSENIWKTFLASIAAEASWHSRGLLKTAAIKLGQFIGRIFK